MALDATAVISGRNFRVYYNPYDDTNALPAVTADFDAPGAPYSDGELGLTQGGLNFQMGLTRGEIRADQLFLPIVRPLQTADFQMGANLMEFTPRNINLATGIGSIDSLAPGVGTRGHNTLEVNEEFADQENTFLFGINQPDNMPFWLIGYRCIAIGSPQTSFTADNAAVIPMTVAPLPDTSVSPARIMDLRDVLPPT
jgi:hypothetical protein